MVAATPIKPRLRVAGQCANCGRNVNRLAPPGRATLKISCPVSTCQKPMTLRRLTDAQAATPTTTEPAAPAATPRKKVPRAADYRRPSPKPGPPVRVPDDGGPGGGGGEPRAEPGPPPGGGAPADPPQQDAPPAPRRRRFARRASQPETGRRAHPYGDLFGF